MARQRKPRGPNLSFAARPDGVLLDIERLEAAGDADELSGYLIELVKRGEQPQRYEPQFAKHWHSPEPYLRKAAVFCLLFVLQIDNPAYRAAALAFVRDAREDEEVRRWAAAGLAQTYRATQDRELLAAFFAVLDDEAENESVKSSLIPDILLLIGLDSRTIYGRSSSSSVGRLGREFATELAAARQLLRPAP